MGKGPSGPLHLLGQDKVLLASKDLGALNLVAHLQQQGA